MSRTRLLVATTLAMLAFAGNSLLCRLALRETHIDAATFTSVRLISGALMLWLIVRTRDGVVHRSASVPSALALFGYASLFSFAYVGLPAATGALLLFGAVQVTMIGFGIWTGERLRALSVIGSVCAFGGLLELVLPGIEAPPVTGSALMIGAGIAWGIYSLRGRKTAGDPTQITAGNFLLAIPFTLLLSAAQWKNFAIDPRGIAFAMASGAITSGVGYAIWYTALPGLQAMQAAVVQLSVPVLAAIGGIVLLGEPLTLRLVIASIAILGGIALVIFGKARPK